MDTVNCSVNYELFQEFLNQEVMENRYKIDYCVDKIKYLDFKHNHDDIQISRPEEQVYLSSYEDGNNCGNNYMFPKNKSRTFITGNSRLAKLHLWSTTDSYEKTLYDTVKELENLLESYPVVIVSNCIHLCHEMSKLYNQHKKKKNKNKVFSFCIFHVFKNQNMLINHQKISQILRITPKQVCKGLKDVSNFLNEIKFDLEEYFNSASNSDNTDFSNIIFNYLKKLELDVNLCYEITQFYKKLKDLTEFSLHRPNSLILASIIHVLAENKIDYCRKTFCKICEISETTLYQINKKISLIISKDDL